MSNLVKKTLGAGSVFYLQNPFSVILTSPEAEVPFKENLSDVGWNLTLVGRVNNRIDDLLCEVNEFTTGVKLAPPPGYYFEVILSPEMARNGYMLATGACMALNPSTSRDEIVVPLYKFKECDDLSLPCRGVLIVLREALYAHAHTVKSLAVKSEPRGRGTFSLSTTEEDEIELPVARPARRTKSATSTTKTTGSSKKSNHMF